jgi:hypothetical protein
VFFVSRETGRLTAASSAEPLAPLWPLVPLRLSLGLEVSSLGWGVDPGVSSLSPILEKAVVRSTTQRHARGKLELSRPAATMVSTTSSVARRGAGSVQLGAGSHAVCALHGGVIAKGRIAAGLSKAHSGCPTFLTGNTT